MNYLEKLRVLAEEVETEKAYEGYYYKASDVITILVIGLLCNLRTAHEIWQWSKSSLMSEIWTSEFGIEKLPCYAQFMNILGNIKADSLNEIFMEWCKYLIENGTKDKTIAIDGKTVCSTTNINKFENPLHIVSAYISEYGITIGQVAVESKSNEIPATQALIKMLDIQGAVVVADALNSQKKTAKAIVDGEGDYLLAAKGNQTDLYNDIKLFFETEKEKLNKYEQCEKSHGRLETRTAWVTHDIGWYEKSDNWANLACFGAVRRVSVEKGKVSEETRYYISSRKMSAEDMLKYSRNEWGVESMHWMLDVIFNEDRTLLMNENAQRTLNILRKTALNLVKIYKTKSNVKSSMVGIMRNNLFNPHLISRFLSSLGSIVV